MKVTSPPLSQLGTRTLSRLCARSFPGRQSRWTVLIRDHHVDFLLGNFKNSLSSPTDIEITPLEWLPSIPSFFPPKEGWNTATSPVGM